MDGAWHQLGTNLAPVEALGVEAEDRGLFVHGEFRSELRAHLDPLRQPRAR